MDIQSKGREWIGHIRYQFLNFCAEVEDIIAQEPLKYVEDQLVSAGESVKQFCSDIVQDITSNDSDVNGQEEESSGANPSSPTSSVEPVDELCMSLPSAEEVDKAMKSLKCAEDEPSVEEVLYTAVDNSSVPMSNFVSTADVHIYKLPDIIISSSDAWPRKSTDSDDAILSFCDSGDEVSELVLEDSDGSMTDESSRCLFTEAGKGCTQQVDRQKLDGSCLSVGRDKLCPLCAQLAELNSYRKDKVKTSTAVDQEGWSEVTSEDSKPEIGEEVVDEDFCESDWEII